MEGVEPFLGVGVVLAGFPVSVAFCVAKMGMDPVLLRNTCLLFCGVPFSTVNLARRADRGEEVMDFFVVSESEEAAN